MTELWLGFAVLLVLAMAFIFLPTIVTFRRGDLVREQANVEIYKDQLADLNTEYEAGRLEESDFNVLTEEVKRNLLADTEKSAQMTTDQTGGRWVMLVGGFFAVAVSVILYNKLGAENELAIAEMLKQSAIAQESWSPKDQQALLERLQTKVEAQPKDVETWYMIGKINFELGRFDEAVLGFNGALNNLPAEAKEDRALAIAQMAQAQFFANGRKLDKATESLLNEAVKLNPNDSTTLGLLGVAAFDSEQYTKAIKYWRQLLTLMSPNNPNVAPIRSGIEKALSLIEPSEREAILSEMKAEMDAAKANAASIQVTVDLSEEIRDQVPETADLFVMAKAESGPPLPLAVQRVAVDSWPITVELNDQMAMMPQLKLSAFESVVITARISKSGDGKAAPGDIEGKSSAISVKADKANVSIAYVIK